MPPDSSAVSTILSNPLELIKLILAIVGILGGLVTITVAFIKTILPWWRTKRDRRSLKIRFGAELYPIGAIENSTRYYIEPFCQSLDPAGSEEPRLTYGAKQNLFDAIDDALNHPTEYRYIFLLADSGMGKTSFLLNYYARHIRKRRRKFKLALVPLGIPDADKRIKRIKKKNTVVLFLDALDEDTLAIVDHVERLHDLLKLTGDFDRVLITCRTQFFPKDEEIPTETGYIKIGPRGAGEPGQYLFHKLYLTPFTNEQIQMYLKCRYPFGQRKRRKQAIDMVEKIPQLSVRPMLLSYIKDLVAANREISYSFELFEEMVEAWLQREEGIVEGLKKKPLRNFSERLAVDLYVNRETRGAERIPRDELTALAQEWNIPLDDWQLTGRSLLNRDAVGNYKFAHRSIMEYLFVKRFTDGEKACHGIVWTDQMKAFLLEMIKYHLKMKISIPFDPTVLDLSGIGLSLRKSPEQNLQSKYVESMIKKFDFFDRYKNNRGKGLEHLYELQEKNSDNIVIDYATGLTWQQSGSRKYILFNEVEAYIKKLNEDNFAGFNSWRLPTLEEAMSLMEPENKKSEFYIDPNFDPEQSWIWTADKDSAYRAWVAIFDLGFCYDYPVDHYDGSCVRAVC